MHFKIIICFLSVLVGIAENKQIEQPPKFDVAVPGYVYLGSYSRNDVNGKVFDESEYYVTFNSKVPIDAVRDCNSIFNQRGGGHLLEFETVDEMKAVNSYLDQYGAGLIYWTGGVYDAIDGYYWQGSDNEMNVPVQSYIQTTLPPRKIDQLVFSHDSSRRFHLEVKPNSNAEAYICEVKRIAAPKCSISAHSAQIPWDEAGNYCSSLGKRVASIETEEKYQCVLDRIQDSGFPDENNYWTAANDIQQEGFFTWSTTKAAVGNFYPTGNVAQPDNFGGNENCVSVRKVFPGGVVGPKHVMNDEVCNLRFSVLCEDFPSN